MFDQFERPSGQFDRTSVVRTGVIPAVATIVTMAVGFSLVAGVLFVRDGLIVDSAVTQVLALAVMYVLPLFVVGLVMGYREGVSLTPAVVAGLTPLVVLVLALGAFGGPVLTAFESPGIALGAVVVWTIVCGLGMLVGANVVASRVSK